MPKLSVIVPKLSAGMQNMLDRELEGIDSEIIENEWPLGLFEASGDFVCLLEEESAVKPGTIRESLGVFLENPSYRKLAMVSPMVDYDDLDDKVSFTFTARPEIRFEKVPQFVHPVRIGYVPGAIIRRKPLLRVIDNHGIFMNGPVDLSALISIALWDNGQRVSMNPEGLYYSPIDTKHTSLLSVISMETNTLSAWTRELIR